MSLRPHALAFILVGLSVSSRPASAEPIYLQIDGTLTSVTGEVSNIVDQTGGFSFVFGWDPAAAQYLGAPSSSYTLPFSVEGYFGTQSASFQGVDYTALHSQFNSVYFERDSMLAVSPLRYGPDGTWGVRAFTLTLAGWDDPLTGVPTSGAGNLTGSFVLYFNEIRADNRVDDGVGAVRGQTTSVRPIPEPSSALMLLLGACAAIGRSVRTRRGTAHG